MHGMKRDLLVVRASLNGQVTAPDGGLQVIAEEVRQVHQRSRTAVRQAESNGRHRASRRSHYEAQPRDCAGLTISVPSR